MGIGSDVAAVLVFSLNSPAAVARDKTGGSLSRYIAELIAFID